uniref:adenylate cyclase n=1 Tax=Timema genevievae TaxID=629358 RepID=A0A7R9JUW6_TIMGE|nr:unnamed protein product [Timema genevievae]
MFTPDRYSDHWMPWAGFGVAICLLLSLLPLTWSHYIWNKWQDPHQELEVINDPRNRLVMFLYKSSLKVVWSSPTRIFLYLIMCSTLTGCAMLELLECDIDVEQGKKNLNKTMTTLSLSMEEQVLMSQCLPPWQVTETCSLVIIMSFLFLRIHFQLKLLVGCLIVGFFSWAVWFLNPELFSQGETWNPGMHPMVAHVLSIVFLTVTLHLLDRQVSADNLAVLETNTDLTEYMNRLDYKWKRQLAVEQEEGTTTHMVNKMLLENILPVHVAKLYLNTNRSYGELYHEEYNTVAVMFATITGYALWDEDNPYGNNQRTSLIVLNHIICDFDKVGYLWENIMCDFDKVGYLWENIMCDFDKLLPVSLNRDVCPQLLFDPSCLRVEKIKMAGWTYMAACGLDPGRRDSNLSLSRQTYSEHVLVVLARFATKMMRVLVRHTVGQDFTLRVGISHGKVTAGVVGSRKPLYDIWGDAVNMASRMDSTGESGRIQVPAETARVLREEGVSCTRRGITFVKGKGDMMTYFVDTDEELRLVSDNHPNTGGQLETQSQSDHEEFITRL